MTITIREQVLAALRNNLELNNAKLAALIGMDTKEISGTVCTLLAGGMTSYGMRVAPHKNSANSEEM